MDYYYYIYSYCLITKQLDHYICIPVFICVRLAYLLLLYDLLFLICYQFVIYSLPYWQTLFDSFMYNY